ncbi:alcohol dehydrogenase-like 1 [Gossypium raimondii]|uniref:alcohol dehydrogenase-like 1 n=1 Tax=Gossypium raimondii TaxID=29730 RepID=UPI00227C9970|nr:alcohol dehydrogenase-like 1 [Gossypium raimondii]
MHAHHDVATSLIWEFIALSQCPCFHCRDVAPRHDVTFALAHFSNVVKISPKFPIDKACLLSCGISTGIGTAWKVADIEEGTVGLAVAEAARLRGASKIIGVDLIQEKMEIGKKFGVTHFINPMTCGEKKFSEMIKEITDGGADYCFERIGLASLMEDAFNSSRVNWGKTVILGLEMHRTPLAINTSLLLRGRTVIGCLFGGLKPKSGIPFLAQKYRHKELNLDGFKNQEVGFGDINKALDSLLEGKSLRCIMRMD